MTDLRKELKKVNGEAGKQKTKIGQLQRQVDDQRALAKDWKGKFTELNAKVTKARTQKKLLTTSLQGAFPSPALPCPVLPDPTEGGAVQARTRRPGTASCARVGRCS